VLARGKKAPAAAVWWSVTFAPWTASAPRLGARERASTPDASAVGGEPVSSFGVPRRDSWHGERGYQTGGQQQRVLIGGDDLAVVVDAHEHAWRNTLFSPDPDLGAQIDLIGVRSLLIRKGRQPPLTAAPA